MNSITLKSKSRFIKSTAGRLARWIAADALIGAVGGALFGFVFGGLSILVQPGTSQFPWIVLYFAACGLAAGALLGACGAMLEDDLVIAAVVDECLRKNPASRRIPVSQSDSRRVSQHHPPENRLLGLSTNNRLAHRLALRTPSRN